MDELVSESDVQDFPNIEGTTLTDQFVEEGLLELIKTAGPKKEESPPDRAGN